MLTIRQNFPSSIIYAIQYLMTDVLCIIYLNLLLSINSIFKASALVISWISQFNDY